MTDKLLGVIVVMVIGAAAFAILVVTIAQDMLD